MELNGSIPWFFLFLLIPLFAGAQTETTDTATILQEITVTAPGASPSTGSRIIRISADKATRMTRAVGEADLISTVKSLSGVSSSSDYSSGFSIEGASPAQTFYYINSAPVIFPYRFGGVFSTFNPYHFSSATFKRRHDIGETPHLGGSLNFIPRKASDGLTGALNIGMTAASASIADTLPNDAFIRASGRVSYLNQVYGPFLKSNKNAIAYSFADFNLTGNVKIAGGNLQLNAFHNFDRLSYEDFNSANVTKLEWTNTLVSLRHTVNRDFKYITDLYYSGFSNTLIINSSQTFLKVPSSLRTIGTHFSLLDINTDKPLDLKYTVNVESYFASPQRASLEFTSETPEEYSDFSSPLRRETLISVLGGCEALWRAIPDMFELTSSVNMGFIHSNIEKKSYNKFYFSPAVNAQWIFGKNIIDAEISIRNQYLHRIGFSEIGLASDFWIVANGRAPLEHSINTSLSWQSNILPWDISTLLRVYHSWVFHQPEYSGLVLEIVQNDYDPLSRLIVANGSNSGASISASREIGNMTGSISYSYGTGKRYLPDRQNTWRALNSEGHDLKIQAAWDNGRHWIFASSLNLSSGRVYTPVKSIYAIGGNIAMDYGARNSKRLPSHFCLNLSCTYQFKSGMKKSLNHSLNFSIINATAHRNIEMQYFILNSENGTYELKRIYSKYRFLPSISYSIEF